MPAVRANNWLKCYFRACLCLYVARYLCLLMATVKAWRSDVLSAGSKKFTISQIVRDLAWSPVGNKLAIASGNHSIDIIDLLATDPVNKAKTLTGHIATLMSVAFSHDGRFLLSTSLDKTARVWDMQTYTCVRSLPHADQVYTAIASPDGKYWVTGASGGHIVVWNSASGAIMHTLGSAATKRRSAVRRMIFNRAGTYLLTASSDGIVHIYNATAWSFVFASRPHSPAAASSFTVLQFSPSLITFWQPACLVSRSRCGLVQHATARSCEHLLAPRRTERCSVATVRRSPRRIKQPIRYKCGTWLRAAARTATTFSRTVFGVAFHPQCVGLLAAGSSDCEALLYSS